MLCLWLGIALGATPHLATSMLISSRDHFALPLVVFGVALIVVGLRMYGTLGNMLAWVLGMVTFYAADLEPAPASLLGILLGTALGGLGGLTCKAMNRRFAE